MRIFAKRAFDLGTGINKFTGEIDTLVTIPMSFMDIPDDKKNHPLFKLAVDEGSIIVVDGKAEQKNIEDSLDRGEFKNNNTKENMTTVEEYYELLKTKSKEEVLKEAKRLNVHLIGDESNNALKKKVFESYKISLKDEE
jgi:hypothetical protein